MSSTQQNDQNLVVGHVMYAVLGLGLVTWGWLPLCVHIWFASTVANAFAVFTQR
jgi:hypothetical protein